MLFLKIFLIFRKFFDDASAKEDEISKERETYAIFLIEKMNRKASTGFIQVFAADGFLVHPIFAEYDFYPPSTRIVKSGIDSVTREIYRRRV